MEVGWIFLANPIRNAILLELLVALPGFSSKQQLCYANPLTPRLTMTIFTCVFSPVGNLPQCVDGQPRWLWNTDTSVHPRGTTRTIELASDSPATRRRRRLDRRKGANRTAPFQTPEQARTWIQSNQTSPAGSGWIWDTTLSAPSAPIPIWTRESTLFFELSEAIRSMRIASRPISRNSPVFEWSSVAPTKPIVDGVDGGCPIEHGTVCLPIRLYLILFLTSLKKPFSLLRSPCAGDRMRPDSRTREGD